jgi:hypothetical protein
VAKQGRGLDQRPTLARGGNGAPFLCSVARYPSSSLLGLRSPSSLRTQLVVGPSLLARWLCGGQDAYLGQRRLAKSLLDPEEVEANAKMATGLLCPTAGTFSFKVQHYMDGWDIPSSEGLRM